MYVECMPNRCQMENGIERTPYSGCYLQYSADDRISDTLHKVWLKLNFKHLSGNSGAKLRLYHNFPGRRIWKDHYGKRLVSEPISINRLSVNNPSVNFRQINPLELLNTDEIYCRETIYPTVLRFIEVAGRKPPLLRRLVHKTWKVIRY